jgi:hypothetical protein
MAPTNDDPDHDQDDACCLLASHLYHLLSLSKVYAFALVGVAEEPGQLLPIWNAGAGHGIVRAVLSDIIIKGLESG